MKVKKDLIKNCVKCVNELKLRIREFFFVPHFQKLFRTTLDKIKAEVSKDITTRITRIGDFRADSKIKWVDFCESFAEIEAEKLREYRVTFLGTKYLFLF